MDSISKDHLFNEELENQNNDLNMNDSDDDLTVNKKYFEPVRMIMDDYDTLYYVVKMNSEIVIMEGNSRDPKLENHQAVFKMKTKMCRAFYMFRNTFYIMDENKTIRMLRRLGQSRNLFIIKELVMEMMQRIDYEPSHFSDPFICEKYALEKSKIFYLYQVNNQEEYSVNRLLNFDQLQ